MGPLLFGLFTLLATTCGVMGRRDGGGGGGWPLGRFQEEDAAHPSFQTNQDFTADDENEMLEDLAELMGDEGEGEGSPYYSMGKRSAAGLSKRFTVDFNGMQVSYPTFVRLQRLQEKVVKLQRMINILHERYTQEQLDGMPQYQRLMSLYSNLRPLLPGQLELDLTSPRGAAEAAAAVADDDEERAAAENEKRAGVNVEFMGMTVTYPQYLRLKMLQEKVIKLDTVMRMMAAKTPEEQLEANPKWQRLVTLHASLKKLLPEGHSEHLGDNAARRKKSPEFNGVAVSLPEYARLKAMQKQALKLDRMMKQLMQKMGPEKLKDDPKWARLLSLRQSLQKLMPA